VREGNEWHKREEAIDVWGYREELEEGVAIPMVQIPAGEFLMGSPPNEEGRSDDEGPKHRLTLPRFFLGQTPVTQAEWQVVAGWRKVGTDLNPERSRFKGASKPVECVGWTEAIEFCQRLSERSGKAYTLPSEAQWEYACRAGTQTPFAFGETLTTELANYDGSLGYGSFPKGKYRKQTTPVGLFPANACGLHDMHGNVWKWCLDTWHGNYFDAPTDGRPWRFARDEGRLLRGGCWKNHPAKCRSASRFYGDLDFAYYGVGFRVVCLP